MLFEEKLLKITLYMLKKKGAKAEVCDLLEPKRQWLTHIFVSIAKLILEFNDTKQTCVFSKKFEETRIFAQRKQPFRFLCYKCLLGFGLSSL